LGADPLKQAAAGHTMVAGAVALTVYAVVAVLALHRFGVAPCCAAWAILALAVYPVLS
jgi:hypothetical protein